MHFFLTVFAVAFAIAFQVVEATHREDHNNRLGDRTHSPPRSTTDPSSPQPMKSMKEVVWDHWKTESERSSNAVRGNVVALTIGGHTAIGMARPIARYACQTATCANPSEKQHTENEIKTKYKFGKAAVKATLRKTKDDLDYSKANRKIHLHNYRAVRNANGQIPPQFLAEYSPEKNQREQQQIANEKSDFYSHSKYLKNLIREPHNYPSNPQIEYPNHNT